MVGAAGGLKFSADSARQPFIQKPARRTPGSGLMLQLQFAEMHFMATSFGALQGLPVGVGRDVGGSLEERLEDCGATVLAEQRIEIVE